MFRQLIPGLAAALLLSSSVCGVEETPLQAIRVATGFERPVHITSFRDDPDRLLVLEQYTGRVRVLHLDTLEIDPHPFMTLGGLGTQIEEGLVNFAFDPNFDQTGRFYVMYVTADAVTHVARGQVPAGPAFVVPTFEVILSLPQPTTIHHGGSLGFGPDGYLYVSLGDGGGAADPGDRAQDLRLLHGKLLRLDVSVSQGYAIPFDNPFLFTANARPEIWAFGLRNPWRFTFDRESGDLFIGDVGQSTREEINVQRASSSGGENYGWRCYEGSVEFSETGTNPCQSCQSPACPMVFPAFEYDTTQGVRGCVVAGYVYRGEDIPDLHGTFFFADYVRGSIGSFRYVDGQACDVRDRTVELTPDVGSLAGVVAFGEDARGELYMCNRMSGDVFKIVPVPQGIAGDLDGNGTVDFDDLLILLGFWGPCVDGPCEIANIVTVPPSDQAVDFEDLIFLLGQWGETG